MRLEIENWMTTFKTEFLVGNNAIFITVDGKQVVAHRADKQC